MKAFIWERVSEVSENWHCGGGLLVVAADRAQAVAMIEAEPACSVDEREWKEVLILELAGNPEPLLLTFPDAGCC